MWHKTRDLTLFCGCTSALSLRQSRGQTQRRGLTVLLPALALLAFGSGDEVRVADGLADVEVLLFGRHSLGGRAGQRGASPLLYQASKHTDDRVSAPQALWVNAPHLYSLLDPNDFFVAEYCANRACSICAAC